MEQIDYFFSVPDSRVKGHCKHKLSDILIIAIATYLCGGDDYASSMSSVNIEVSL